METLGPVLAEKEQAENHLMASGLTHIIIRPGGLRSEPPKGEGVLTEDPSLLDQFTGQMWQTWFVAV